MQPWMLRAPAYDLSPADEEACQAALGVKTAALLPEALPRWVFLRWLAEQGFLLHGSPVNDLKELHPADKAYRQPDEFSNTIGVYAASDGIWAMMYALRNPQTTQMSDMCLRLREEGQWSEMLYFMSLAPRQGQVNRAEELLTRGSVYVLSREGFQSSPPYHHSGLGEVQESHWVSPSPVRPLFTVPVQPADFPLPVRLHDRATVDARCRADPWGFPWLTAHPGWMRKNDL
ncbi:hypothetical protein [Deinococcus wulumuqiensis]|nr:hypothetical protein [Deinococcus wulumuqiensis]QII21699.1 hypothetical protein G6R31_01575 [Deinococcus wulumuqiensis R12]